MRTHEDRPGGTGGYPDDRTIANAPVGGATPPGRPAAPAGRASTGAQAPGVRNQEYYDDGYSAPATSYDRGSDQYDDHFAEQKSFGWNGGTDLGLLILRLAVGASFIAHGSQKLFGAIGGPGPEKFAQMLQQMGFQQSSILALVTGGTELGAGALLVLGLFTPIAAAGLLGVMANAALVMLPGGILKPTGLELPAVYGVIALTLLFTGPGRVALDYGRVWFRKPVTFGFIALLIAAGASAAVLLVLHHPTHY